MSLGVVKAASYLLACWVLTGAPLAVGQSAASASAAASTPDDSIPPITVQITPPRISISPSMMGVAGPLGAKAAAGKPIAAEFVTIHHQSFSDGNHIARSTLSVIYRDSAGRIRRESQLSVPGLPANFAATFITIVDQSQGCGWVLDPREMVAHLYQLNGDGPSYMASLSAQGGGGGLHPTDTKAAADSAAAPSAADSSRWRMHTLTPQFAPAQDPSAAPSAMSSGETSSPAEESGVAGAPAMRIDQPFLAAPNPVRTENLGEEVILGYRVHGTRVITTLPAGQIGNDLPIDIVSEQWFSPDLQLVMRSMHRDPWVGEFTTTVTKVNRGEQPAWRFKVPSQYKIVDASTEGDHHSLGSHAPGSAAW